jgi:hypothetical protein
VVSACFLRDDCNVDVFIGYRDHQTGARYLLHVTTRISAFPAAALPNADEPNVAYGLAEEWRFVLSVYGIDIGRPHPLLQRRALIVPAAALGVDGPRPQLRTLVAGRRASTRWSRRVATRRGMAWRSRTRRQR